MNTHILLIEDTEDLGENIRDILSIEGYLVTWMRNGVEGYQSFKKSKPDLIVTDIVMPHMNGLELIHHVRATKGCEKLPIVVLTAKATPEDQLEGIEAGANIYLKKPCNSAELIDSIRSLLPIS